MSIDWRGKSMSPCAMLLQPGWGLCARQTNNREEQHGITRCASAGLKCMPTIDRPNWAPSLSLFSSLPLSASPPPPSLSPPAHVAVGSITTAWCWPLRFRCFAATTRNFKTSCHFGNSADQTPGSTGTRWHRWHSHRHGHTPISSPPPHPLTTTATT